MTFLDMVQFAVVIGLVERGFRGIENYFQTRKMRKFLCKEFPGVFGWWW